MNEERYIKRDRMRFTKNTLSSTLVLAAILFDVFYFVNIYKSDVGHNVGNFYYQIRIGASIVNNLVFMLAAFLSSEGVKNDKIEYGYVPLVLGAYIGDLLDQLLVIGIAMGVITDLLVNNILRFYAKTPGENDRWMMFPKKRYGSFPLNILCSFVVLLFVFMLYNVLNAALVRLTGAAVDAVPLGVEAVLFGLFYLGVDLLFLALKHLPQRVIADAKRR